MLKQRFLSAALIAIACAAALTSCTANNQTSGDDKPNGGVGGIEEGVSDMVSDVQDGLGDKEDATHGIKPDDKNENGNKNEGGATQKHREAVPFGK